MPEPEVNDVAVPSNAAITYAVVATCVVLVPTAAVGAVGVPVNAGLALNTTLPVPVAVEKSV